MTDRFDALEASVASLAVSVERLEKRIAALEAEPASAAISMEASRGIEVETEESSWLPVAAEGGLTTRLTRIVTLVGRTLLVLAGAFLLRALTDSGTLPTPIGVGLGLLYATSWFVAAARAAARRRPASAAAHGVGAAMIAYPLIWEAAGSFHVLSSNSAVLAVAGVTALGLTLAWRHGLRTVAWVVTLAALLTSVALMFVAQSPVAGTWFVVALGLVTLWIGRSRSWPVLPWLPAIVADLAVVRLTGMAASPWAAEQPNSGVGVMPALALVIVLLVGYLGSVVVQVFLRRRSVGAFDVVQTAGVLAAGLGGAIEVSGASQGGWIGLATLIAAVACYWAAFMLVPATTGTERDFVFFSTLALVLLLIGLPILVGGGVASVLWGLLAVMTAFIGGRHDRVTLRAHAAVLAVAAAVSSGLASFEIGALGGGPADGPWRHPAIQVHAVLAALIAALVVVARSRRGRPLRWFYRLPLVVIVGFAAAGLCAELVALLAGPGLLDLQTDAGFAMLRTGAMALGALALAGFAVRFELPELGWLVYPVLVLVGLKIVLQDLRVGGPLSIAVAFVFYGAALILGPRLLRSTDRSGSTIE